MSRQAGAVLAFVITIAATDFAAGSSASAAPVAVHRLDPTSIVELAARCPPGYRRHTITAKCVRRQPRFPLLSWF